jgi:hypothetical protein
VTPIEEMRAEIERELVRKTAPLVRNLGQCQLLAIGIGCMELGRRAKISKSVASYWLHGQKLPSRASALRLQAEFGIDPGDWDKPWTSAQS